MSEEPLIIRCRENGPLVLPAKFKIVDHLGNEFVLPAGKENVRQSHLKNAEAREQEPLHAGGKWHDRIGAPQRGQGQRRKQNCRKAVIDRR